MDENNVHPMHPAGTDPPDDPPRGSTKTREGGLLALAFAVCLSAVMISATVRFCIWLIR